MTYHAASLDLISLIRQISGLTVPLPALQSLADRTTSLIRAKLGAVRVSLTLRAGKDVISSEAAAPVRGHKAGFLFSRPISSRNENYGSLQVDLDRPEHPPELLLTALDTISSMVGLYASRIQLTEDNVRLALSNERARAAVADSKTLVRATGIVAAIHGWSLGAAQNWLQSESMRTRRSVAEIADLIVLQRQAVLDQPYRRSA